MSSVNKRPISHIDDDVFLLFFFFGLFFFGGTEGSPRRRSRDVIFFFPHAPIHTVQPFGPKTVIFLALPFIAATLSCDSSSSGPASPQTDAQSFCAVVCWFLGTESPIPRNEGSRRGCANRSAASSTEE